MKRWFCLLLLCVFSISLFASSKVNARMLPYDSPIYDYLDALYVLTGKTKPSTVRPWSEAQGRMHLEALQGTALDEEETKLYQEVEMILDEGLRWQTGEESALTVEGVFTLEGYAHTNSSFCLEGDWKRGYSERKPLIHLGLEFSSNDHFYTSADINYQFGRTSIYDECRFYLDPTLPEEEKLVSKDGYVGSYKVDPTASHVTSSYYFSSPFMTNFYTNTLNFSFIWPKRAIFSMGGDRWNFSFNRDRLKVGDSHIGNLLIDDYSDYNDYMRLTFFGRDFTYDWILMYFNTLTSKSEDMTTEGRMFMVHTLDFDILDRVSLKLSENVMYRYSVFDMQFLNPAFFYHNLNNRSLFNALAYIEVNAALGRGFNLYSQYAMDQARAPNEGYSQSDASGFILGLEQTSKAFGGILTSYGEYLCTTPLLYRRDGVDFIKASRYYHMGTVSTGFDGNGNQHTDWGGHMPFFEFIGYQFGGDTRTVKLGSCYSKPGVLEAEAYIQALEHGEVTMYHSHNRDGNNEDDANLGGKTPSGNTITRSLLLGFKADWNLEEFFSYPGLSGQVEVDWIGVTDYTKSTKKYSNSRCDLQLSAGVTVAF